MNLTHAQKAFFRDNGYLHLPGAVAPAQVDAARRAINASLGEGLPPDQMTTFRVQSFCPELRDKPAITDLLARSSAWDAAEAAIGPGQIKPGSRGQIALRFPTLDDPPKPATPHIDGMYSPTNGVPKGTIANFTALVGVILSDIPADNCGNFTVWPGSHLLNQSYFREKGPQSLLEGMPKVTLPPPVQITGKPGDAVLAHYLLSHGISPNTSPNIRYMIFFRLHHKDHENQKWESMTDAFLQWPGVR